MSRITSEFAYLTALLHTVNFARFTAVKKAGGSASAFSNSHRFLDTFLLWLLFMFSPVT